MSTSTCTKDEQLRSLLDYSPARQFRVVRLKVIRSFGCLYFEYALVIRTRLQSRRHQLHNCLFVALHKDKSLFNRQEYKMRSEITHISTTNLQHTLIDVHRHQSPHS